MTPKKLFNFFATAEAFTWTALIIVISLRAASLIDPSVSTIVAAFTVLCFWATEFQPL